MIMDAQLLFSDAQAITAAAGSTNTIDLGVGRDIGTGEPLQIFVSIDVAFTDTGSDSTLTVALEGDSTTTFTPDASTTLLTIPALAAAGNMYVATLSPGADAANYRYIRLKYTPNGGDLTTGTVTAGIVKNAPKQNYYADAITIS
jgi:hypothetical protein